MRTAGVSSAGGAIAWWRPDLPVAERTKTPSAQEPAERPGGIAFWGLVFFTFVLLISPQAIVPALASFRLAMLAVAITGLAVVGDRLRRGQPLSLWTRHLTIAVTLGAWAAVTVPFSLWPGGSAQILFGVFAKSLVVFWLIV